MPIDHGEDDHENTEIRLNQHQLELAIVLFDRLLNSEKSGCRENGHL
jgi:hypothetical protein